MRLEDYGKKLVKNVDPLEINIIREKLESYFKNNEASVYHILLSKEVSYYTVFKINYQYKTIDNFIEFLED
jgi:hypothetical protein